MGVLTDLVVAPKDAAEALNDASYAERKERGWESHESKFFTPDVLGFICAVIEGLDPDAPVDPPKWYTNPFTGEKQVTQFMEMVDRFELTSGDDGERVVMRCPDDFMRRLAELEGPTFTRTASGWRDAHNRSNPLKLSQTEAEEGLVILRDLSRQAIDRGHAVFLWVCP